MSRRRRRSHEEGIRLTAFRSFAFPMNPPQSPPLVRGEVLLRWVRRRGGGTGNFWDSGASKLSCARVVLAATICGRDGETAMREFLQKKATLVMLGGIGLVAGSFCLLGSGPSNGAPLATATPVDRNPRTNAEPARIERRATKTSKVAVGDEFIKRERIDEPTDEIKRRSPRTEKTTVTKKKTPPAA